MGEAKDFTGIGNFPGDGGGGDHHRAHEDGASAWTPLAAFKISIGRTRAELVADELVGVHREAHRTARAAPLETRSAEDLIEPFLFAQRGHDLTARDGDRFDVRSDFSALQIPGDLADAR